MTLSILPWHKRSKESADPFYALQQEVNKLFEQFNGGEIERVDGTLADWNPKMDVAETEKEIQVSAELPGVDEKDIDVAIEKGVLTIKGEKKAEKEEKDKNYYRTECSYGSFYRAFTLPKEIDEQKVEATFKKGVLTVKLPKTKEAQAGATKIAIKNA